MKYLVKRAFAVFLGASVLVPGLLPLDGVSAAHAAKKKKKKKKEEKPPEKPTQPIIPETAPVADPVPSERKLIPAPEYKPVTDKVEVAAEKGQSKLTGGQRIRWSNAGAMQPIESTEVPVSVPLPERAIPKPIGVATPGQRLLSPEDESLSAHFSLFASHAETVRQDELDSDLYRGRATMAYRRIGGSLFSAHLDLEYRALSSGTRPTDRRIDALYVSWGLTEFSNKGGPDFGVALGRVLIPEAGQAQANGLALRLRLSDAIRLGAFGGVSGNPYNYNFRLHKTEDFGADWITGGAFGSFRSSDWVADVAGSVTMANTSVGKGGIDRLYAFADVGWMVSDSLDTFLTAWFDVLPSRQPVQSLELATTWVPRKDTNLRLTLGRFSTATYDSSSLWSYRIDPTSGTLSFTNPVGVTTTGSAIDENGNFITPYAKAFQLAIYNHLELRGGMRFEELGLSPFAAVDVLMRDGSQSLNQNRGVRIEPSAGVGYRNPDIVDVDLRVTGIVDPDSQANMYGELLVSRSFFGFILGADARYILGTVPSADGGVSLAYVAPAWLMPGRLMLRGMFRYFRENVSIVRPIDKDILANTDVLPVVPLQESFYGGAGIDWKL